MRGETCPCLDLTSLQQLQLSLSPPICISPIWQSMCLLMPLTFQWLWHHSVVNWCWDPWGFSRWTRNLGISRIWLLWLKNYTLATSDGTVVQLWLADSQWLHISFVCFHVWAHLSSVCAPSPCPLVGSPSDLPVTVMTSSRSVCPCCSPVGTAKTKYTVAEKENKIIRRSENSITSLSSCVTISVGEFPLSSANSSSGAADLI